jgi:putative CocE/NonD family hydrolase
VVVTRRGMGRSQGESVAFFNDVDVEDHAKVIAWVAAQPWCDGNVVLFGTSYYGIVQPQVAAKQPPALRGFFSIEMCTDFFRHIAMFGGGSQPDFLALWMGANFTDFQVKLHVPPLVRAVMSHLINSPLKHWRWPQVKKRMHLRAQHRSLRPGDLCRASSRPRDGAGRLNITSHQGSRQ